MSGEYSIPIGGIKEGKHTYEFEIGKKFFELFEESEVREGSLKVRVNSDKRSSLVDLEIRIDGTITISCDRCLALFSHPVSCENRLLVKFGKTFDESDPDIITLPRDEKELDMSHYFYEYILLALPISRMHPEDEEGKSNCDPEMLKTLSQHFAEDEESDPRWDELKKLMNN
jgi:uncharacterized metal-binding protein YceD (DUF177 family)